MDAFPLEGAYLISAVSGRLIGFCVMRWHRLTRGAGSLAAAEFFYVLGQASFVAGCTALALNQLWQLKLSGDALHDVLSVLPILIIVLIALPSMVMLAAIVAADGFFGPSKTKPQP